MEERGHPLVTLKSQHREGDLMELAGVSTGVFQWTPVECSLHAEPGLAI